MAEISDLTTPQLETLVAFDFATALQKIFKYLDKLEPANDQEKAEIDTLRVSLLNVREIIEACGNSSAVAADAILNP
jgi:hypothetical protein